MIKLKRVWKPLNIGGKRLYSVKLEYFSKDTGYRACGNVESPLLVMASSPRAAARLVHKIYSLPDSPIRTECYGKATTVLMLESWWQDGIPSCGNEVDSDIEE